MRKVFIDSIIQTELCALWPMIMWQYYPSNLLPIISFGNLVIIIVMISLHNYIDTDDWVYLYNTIVILRALVVFTEVCFLLQCKGPIIAITITLASISVNLSNSYSLEAGIDKIKNE